MPKTKKSRQIHSRPPLERMMRIHQLLGNGEYPNCTVVAEEFEVSTRTIKRDVEFMKCRLDLPIEYDSRRYGFYYTEPVEQFPGTSVTEAEIFALLVAHKAIAQYRGTPFQEPLRTAFRKLTGQLDQTTSYTSNSLDEAFSFRPFAPGDTDLRNFEVLTRALQERRAVKFKYRNLGTRQSRRRHVHPHHLACIDNQWYLFAFDVDLKAMRTFVLTRLSQPELTRGKFKRRLDFDPDEHLRGSFTVFKGKEDYEVVVEFDRWATDLVRSRKWHHSQEFIELPGGGSRMRLRLNSIEEMEQWVLGWGVHATVVRPESLIRRIEETAVELQRRYSGDEKARTVGKPGGSLWTSKGFP